MVLQTTCLIPSAGESEAARRSFLMQALLFLRRAGKNWGGGVTQHFAPLVARHQATAEFEKRLSRRDARAFGLAFCGRKHAPVCKHGIATRLRSHPASRRGAAWHAVQRRS